MDSFNLIDFSKATLPDLEELFRQQEPDTLQIVVGWLERAELSCREVNSEFSIPLDQIRFHIGKIRQVAVRLTIFQQHGLTLEEFMAEKFGHDWETQLHRPRGSQSVGKRIDKEIKRENKIASAFNRAAKEAGSEERMNVQVASSSMQMGLPMLSLRPIAVGKDPCLVEIEPGVFGHVHSPGENGVECRAMKSEVFVAPIISVVGAVLTGAGDMTGGCGSKELAIVGFAEHWKSSVCGKIGLVEIPGEHGPEYRSIPEDQSAIGERLLALEMAGADKSEIADWFAELTKESALYLYYASRYPARSAWDLTLKAFTGGTLKIKYFPSLDYGKVCERRLKFAQDSIDNKIRELSGLCNRVTSAEKLAGVLPEITWNIRQMFEGEAVKKLTRNYLLKIRRDHKQLQNPTHGRLRSKQTKMRTGDKSTTVNGMRSGQLENWFGLVRINGVYKEPMNRQRLEEVLSEIGFNWEGYARKRIESGEFKPGWTAADKIGEVNTGLSRKDNREQLAEIMIRRMLQVSLEEVLKLKSGWVGLSNRNLATGELYYSDEMFIEFRHVFGDTEEFGKLQDAAKLVLDAGEELNYKNVWSAYKRPGPWKMLAGKANASPMTQAMLAAQRG